MIKTFIYETHAPAVRRRIGLLLALATPFVVGPGANALPSSPINPSAWPVMWCQAQPGMSKAQLVGVMGQPTTDFTTGMTWSDHHYQFNAFLEQNGTVKQLDINLASLTDAEKAALQCQRTRTLRSMAARPPAHKTGVATNDRPACEIVSQAEMSTILAAPVIAQSSGQSRCIYKTISAGGPHVEFTIDRGDGAAAMSGAGYAGKRDHGLANPFSGIGDQAVAVGPALLIRTADDLVMLVFSGVSNTPAAARKIFEAAKAKM